MLSFQRVAKLSKLKLSRSRGSSQIKEAAQERLLENVISSIDKERRIRCFFQAVVEVDCWGGIGVN